MKTQIRALKVKIKSLAAEAQIIRLEERKVLANKGRPDPLLYASLRNHRTYDVRREQRSALLAYGFLHGKKYAALEKARKGNTPDLARIRGLVEKFGAKPYQTLKIDPVVVLAWYEGTLEVHPFAPKTEAAK